MKPAQAILCTALALGSPAAVFAQAPAAISSSSKLSEDEGKRDSWTYRNPNAVIGKYQSFIIQPTELYSDPTAKWGSTTMEQRRKFAEMMTDKLREEIGKEYQIAQRPDSGVATMKLTLLGVQSTTKLAATASRLTPFGLALNGVKSIAGKEGSFTGSVHVAFELTDSRTGELLFAAVRHRSPDALDIEATLSTEKTVEAVAEDSATAIRKGLDKANGR